MSCKRFDVSTLNRGSEGKEHAYTKGYPGRLRKEGTEELRRGGTDVFEAGVGAIVGSDT